MFLLCRAWRYLTFMHLKNVLFMIVKQTLAPSVTIGGNVVRTPGVSGCMLRAPAWPLTPIGRWSWGGRCSDCLQVPLWSLGSCQQRRSSPSDCTPCWAHWQPFVHICRTSEQMEVNAVRRLGGLWSEPQKPRCAWGSALHLQRSSNCVSQEDPRPVVSVQEVLCPFFRQF